MTNPFPVHTLTSAPPASRAMLEALAERLGFVPNLAASMATSPTLVSGFVGALTTFTQGTLDDGERQIVLLGNALLNRNAWAVAFHSLAALRAGIAPDDVAALRAGRSPRNTRHGALAALVRALVDARGHLQPDDVDAFVAAGYSHAQLLEVIAGLGASLMANYAGNVTRPPLEGPLAAHAWTPPAS